MVSINSHLFQIPRLPCFGVLHCSRTNITIRAHELGHLHADAVEDNHLSSTKSDSKTEAGIAYAKIWFLKTRNTLESVAGLTSPLVKAVYPDLTDSMIEQHTAQSLATRPRVAEVLGTTRRIECSNASDLCSAVQKYMDSKEKSTKLGLQEARMAYWPLIKVIRIFCRAKVLSTGLVIVDLPGVADSNPARSAIATKYMTECSAVWVAAPIKRATDNKVAKELMGKSSRLQMKLDGIYSHVTFICTMVSSPTLLRLPIYHAWRFFGNNYLWIGTR